MEVAAFPGIALRPYSSVLTRCIFFSLECFGRLSLMVNHFSSTSALASQGQGCPRHASWVAMITAVFFICNYEPWHGPQA